MFNLSNFIPGAALRAASINNGRIVFHLPDQEHVRSVVQRRLIHEDVSTARRRVEMERIAVENEDEAERMVNNLSQRNMHGIQQRLTNSQRRAETRIARNAAGDEMLTRDEERPAIIPHQQVPPNDEADARRKEAATQRRAIARVALNQQQQDNIRNVNAVQMAAVRQVETADEVDDRHANDAVRQENYRAVNQNRRNVYNIARQPNPLPEEHYLGPMDKLCAHCNALKFEGEDSFKCCHNGKVRLDNLSPYPQEMRNLLCDNSDAAKNFQGNIRQYNNAFSFASLGARLMAPPGRGPPCFRVCGQIVHRTGTLLPTAPLVPVFSQLYIYDGEDALNFRMNREENSDCSPDVKRTIQVVMDTQSPFAASYRHMAEVLEEENQHAVIENRPPHQVPMFMHRGQDRRRYNEPHFNEVAAVFVGEDGAPPAQRDVIVYPRDQPLQQISSMSANLDPMCYPVLFPRGDMGWHANIPHVAEYATARRTRVTILQYYTYRLAIRPSFSPIHYGRKLFQQFVVDAYVKTEGQRLDYDRRHQADLRVDQYQGLIDHVNNRADDAGLNPGRIVILPSSFQGSPRNMAQQYQDAMAIIAKHGKPDLFLTFTCNPQWREIQENLLPNQQVIDRPDLVSRVFHLKLNAMLRDLFKNGGGVMGKVVAHVYVIEFQKRGLPHVHLLLLQLKTNSGIAMTLMH